MAFKRQVEKPNKRLKSTRILNSGTSVIVNLLIAVLAGISIASVYLRFQHDGVLNLEAVDTVFYGNCISEIISIAFTILILDAIGSVRANRQEKNRLIIQLGSSNYETTTEAIRELHLRGWGIGKDRSLENIYLVRANMSNNSLVAFNLRGVDLEKANLSHTDLLSANLTFANCTDADFQHADLENANFEGSSLRGANFSNANLTGTSVSELQLKQVASLRNATMVGGTRYDGRYALSGDLEVARNEGVRVDDHASMAEWYGVLLRTYREHLP
jgi:hypothetical protein